jgi:hypothetical protein
MWARAAEVAVAAASSIEAWIDNKWKKGGKIRTSKSE